MIAVITTLEGLKSASTEHGVKYAMTCGRTVMQVFSADSLDFLRMVCSEFLIAVEHLFILAINAIYGQHFNKALLADKMEFKTVIIIIIGAITRSSVYQLSALEYYIQSANCTGNEGSIFECPYTLMEVGYTCNSDAGVICQGTIMLKLC